MVSPRDRATEAGREIARELLAQAGGGLDLRQVQERLGGLSREAVEVLVRDGHLLAVPDPACDPEEALLFPACQFGADGTLLPGLGALRAALPAETSAWSVLDLLLGRDHAVDGRRPIDLLRTGSEEDRGLVLEAARGMGVQGA